MDFSSLEGFEEFFSDGVVISSPAFQKNCSKFEEIGDRLFVLYNPPSAAEFDIVFIHGIGSDEFKCWTNDKGILWPSVFLPQDFTSARVLTIGYQHSLWGWKSKQQPTADEQKVLLPTEKEKSSSEQRDSNNGWSSWWTDKAKEDKKAPLDKPSDTLESKKGTHPRTALFDELLTTSRCEEDTDGEGSDENTDAKHMRSIRCVACDIADRLISSGVGTGNRPVVFVAHSMGGLIVKQMLVLLSRYMFLKHRKTGGLSLDAAHVDNANNTAAYRQAHVLLNSTRGVVFYGTPHFGSGLASVITGLHRYYQTLGGLTPTHVVTGLGDHNKEELTLLNEQFMDVVTRLGGGISVLSFGETKRLHNVVRIVEAESANPAPNDARFPFFLIDGDHCEINRPSSKTSPSFAILFGYLDRLQQRGLLVPQSLSGVVAAEGNKSNRLLIESTAPAAEQEAAAHEEAFESLFQLAESTTSAHHAEDSTTLALAAVDVSLTSLRAELQSFFGCLVPSHMDGGFALAADMKQFLRQSVGRLSVHQSEGQHMTQQMHLSFGIPIGLLSAWISRAISAIAGFKLRQAESAASIMTDEESSVTVVTSQLSSREEKEMAELGHEMGVLQGEWEAFRRFWSSAIRSITNKCSSSSTFMVDPLVCGDERIAALYFAQSLYAVTGSRSHGEGLPGVQHLATQFLQGAMAIGADENAVEGSTSADIYTMRTGTMTAEVFEGRDELVALLAEGLRSGAGEGSIDTSKSSSLFSHHRLMTGTSPLLALTSFLLGCYYFNQSHAIPGSTATSRAYFGEALSALEKYTLVCASLSRRRGSKTMQRGWFLLDDNGKGKDAPSSSSSWWSGSEAAKQDTRKKSGGATAGRDGTLAQQRVLTLSFELLVKVHVCEVLLADVEGGPETRSAAATDKVATDWSAAVISMLTSGQRTYAKLDDALQGKDSDISAPFCPAEAPTPTLVAVTAGDGDGEKASPEGGSHHGKGQDKKSAADIQKSFREAVSGIMSELDALGISAKSLKSSDAPTGGKDVTPAVPIADSTTRSGRKSHSLTSRVAMSLIRAWEEVRRGGEDVLTPSSFAHNVLVLWWATEERALMCMSGLDSPSKRLAARKPPAMGLIAEGSDHRTLLSSLSQQDREHYAQSHTSVQSQWITSVAYTHAMQRYQENTHAASGDTLLQDSLMDSLYFHCSSSPVAGCLVAHHFLFSSRSFPEAAHAYLNTLQLTAADPLDPLHQTAAVGLGWVHMHQVSGGRSGLVLDPIAYYGAPEGFHSFRQAMRKSAMDGSTPASQRQLEAAAAQRLSLAEHYFTKVLEVNPTHAGALCGLGRQRTLSFASSSPMGPLLPPSPQLRAQLSSAAFPHLLAAARRGATPWSTPSVNVVMDALISSYAAHWVGEMTLPVNIQERTWLSLAMAHYTDCHLPTSQQHVQAALQESQRWQRVAIERNPRNDWALATMGFHLIRQARYGLRAVGASAPPAVAERCRRDAADGLAHLEGALRVNPSNQWALWGIATQSSNTARREECRRLVYKYCSPLRARR